MTTIGITYFEKPSRDENIDDCQQIGVKLERTFLKFATVDGVEKDNHLRKVCSLFHVFLFLNEKTFLVLFILHSSFHIESIKDKVLIFQQ